MNRWGEVPGRLADLIARWYLPILVATALLVGVAGWRASRLSLKPNLVELLPQNDPAVVTLQDMDRRMARRGRAASSSGACTASACCAWRSPTSCRRPSSPAASGASASRSTAGCVTS
jgi:hypothetical protein